jgi:hypothetical protein
MTKIAGSGYESGSISQRHGSADPDQDPHQNVMDPEHWFKPIQNIKKTDSFRVRKLYYVLIKFTTAEKWKYFYHLK